MIVGASHGELDSLRTLNARLSADLSAVRRSCASAEELAIVNGARAATASAIVSRLQAENFTIAVDSRNARDEERERQRLNSDRIETTLTSVDNRVALVSAESSRVRAENSLLREEIEQLLAERQKTLQTIELERLHAAAIAADADTRVTVAEADARLARAEATAAQTDAANCAPAIMDLSVEFQKTLTSHKSLADEINSKLAQRLAHSVAKQTWTLRQLAEANATAQKFSLLCTALAGERDDAMKRASNA